MVRTQEEILARIKSKESDDFFGTQKSDLIDSLTFENAIEFLKDDYVKDVKDGKQEYKQITDTKEAILDYLPFAYEKCYGQRGLSAARSLLHFKSWIWLDDADFYDKFMSMYNGDHNDYGKSILDAISKHYGFEVPNE